MTLRIEYPSSLPIPQTSTVRPVDRRQLSSADRPREATAFQRDRLELERVTWPPLNATQSAALYAWWKNSLVYGGCWFAAQWPLPRGFTNAVRRFIEAPQWEFIAGGFWRVSAVLQVRGRGLDPVREPLPIFLLHMDGNLFDEMGASFGAAGSSDVPLFTTSAAGFGQQAQFTYSGGGVGQNGATATYAAANRLVDVAEFQIDTFVTINATTRPERSILNVFADGAATETLILSISVKNADVKVVTLFRTGGGGFQTVTEVSAGAADLTPGQRTHIRLTLKDGVLTQWHDGEIVRQLAGAVIDAVVPSATATRVCIGCQPAGVPAGTAFAAFMDGFIDEVRLTHEVTDTEPFDVPTRPFTVPIV